MSLTIDEHREGGWLVLSVVEDLDLYTVGMLRSGLSEVLDTARAAKGASSDGEAAVGPLTAGSAFHGVTVDLAAVSFMDSAGLGVLISAYKHASADGTRFQIAGASPAVTKLFTMTGLSKVLDLHPSVAAAHQAQQGF